jgi:hypothetical protein
VCCSKVSIRLVRRQASSSQTWLDESLGVAHRKDASKSNVTDTSDRKPVGHDLLRRTSASAEQLRQFRPPRQWLSDILARVDHGSGRGSQALSKSILNYRFSLVLGIDACAKSLVCSPVSSASDLSGPAWPRRCRLDRDVEHPHRSLRARIHQAQWSRYPLKAGRK